MTASALFLVLLVSSSLARPDESVRASRKLPILDDACEQSFLACLGDPQCLYCWQSIDDAELDLFDISSATTCTDIIDALGEQGLCGDLTGQGSIDLMCGLFDDCQQEGEEDDDKDDDPSGEIDCSLLTECDWVGFREDFVGDGVCDHWSVGGNNCYNTEICGYDGGDCCEDKCESGSASWAQCGSNGFYCADPESTKCDVQYADSCPNVPTSAPTPTPSCGSGKTLYKIGQFDSWGDGWNQASMTVKDDEADVIYEGSLEEGAEAHVPVCLANGCYDVSLTAGDWGNEISWEIKKASGGTVLASGGAPMNCQFPIGGNFCTNTCDGSQPAPAPIDPDDIPDDDDQANQLQCIAQHCGLQTTDCLSELTGCALCVSNPLNLPVTWCSTNDKYQALTRCEQCHCVEGMEDSCDGSNGGNTCEPTAIAYGGKAVFDWQMCTAIGDANNMIKDWDENEFGALDTFETCAHTYHSDPNHGGRTAQDCMQILYDAAFNMDGSDDIVNIIASKLYYMPGEMCQCSEDAFQDVPNCNTFSRFKVLVHETLDACTSLDEVDCDAWTEFSDKCEPNVVSEFGSVDFYKLSQCEYVKEGCGGAGAFPSFRRLDCGGEIPKKNWDMWNAYSTGCALAEDDDTKPVPVPPAPYPPGPPTPVPPDVAPGPSPSKPKSGGSAAATVFGVLFGVGAVVGAAVWYKRRRDSDAFAGAYRYRPQRDSEEGGQELFSGLSVNSGSFKPPVVPQTHNI
mmetsp:Transcript_2142/g.3952  ORF Transcript_2142/g.3952 Transcript_2142/m.3952 type:complete len:739 (+) Transcript_2142:58-2274(+)